MQLPFRIPRDTAIDWRLVFMGAVLAVLAGAFQVLSGGIFLSPENLYNIAQQLSLIHI